ncbi:MAG: serine hydrolase [Acidobacteriota bacterium]
MQSNRRHVVLGGLLVLTFLMPLVAQARPFMVNAKSAMLIDMSDNRILFEQNADAPIPPASITKVLTLFVLLDALKVGVVHPGEIVRVSSRAASEGGSRMSLRTGDEVPIEELVKGAAVVSGNDACVAIAEQVSGSVDVFVNKMNAKARELGMSSSTFMTPNGLPANGQLTTARDIARLSIAYLRTYPDMLNIHSMTSYTYNRRTHRNANRLLSTCPGVDGLKTGFVCAAGYNISVTARRGDTRLLAVVMGAPSPGIRAAEATKLIEAGFRMTSNPGAPPVIQAEDVPSPQEGVRTAKVLTVRKVVRTASGRKVVKVAVAKPVSPPPEPKMVSLARGGRKSCPVGEGDDPEPRTVPAKKRGKAPVKAPTVALVKATKPAEVDRNAALKQQSPAQAKPPAKQAAEPKKPAVKVAEKPEPPQKPVAAAPAQKAAPIQKSSPQAKDVKAKKG